MATSERALAQPPSLNYLQLFGLRRDPLAAFTSLARRHGHVVWFRGLYAAYQLTHPRDIEHVLQTNAQNYTKGRNYKKFIPATGNGLLVSDGALWRRQRRLAQPAFHRRASRFAAVMAREASARIARRRAKTAGALDVAEEMMRLTLRIVGLTMFTTDLTAETDMIGRSLNVIRAHSIRAMWRPVNLPVWVPTPSNLRFRRALADGDRVMREMIEARRSGESRRGETAARSSSRAHEETARDSAIVARRVSPQGAGHEAPRRAFVTCISLPTREAESVSEGLRRAFGHADARRFAATENTTMVIERQRLYPPAWP